jgi:raffinose/stachyose/melibiose transport system substrate-binding protein
MRNWCKVVCTLIIATLLLASCGGGPNNETIEKDITDTNDEQIKLTLMHNWTGQDGKAIAMRQILQDFRVSHPNIILEDEGLPTDALKTRLRTVAAADEMADLFVMWPDAMTKDFVKGDLIQPVNDYLNSKPEWRDNFIPNAFDDFTVDGQIYTVPMNLAPTSFIYYNQALFDRYHVKVPTTWDEMMTAVETFNARSVIPIALGNKNDWVAQSTIFSTLADRITGTEWFYRAVNQDGASFTDPIFIEALQVLQDFGNAKAFQRGFHSIDDNQMMQLFFEGRAAMFINGGWATSNIVQNAPEEVLKYTHVTILPSIEGGKGVARSTSGVVGTGLGVNKKLSGAKKDLAMELYYALSGPDGQKATLDSSTLVSYKIEPDKSKAHPLFIELHDLVRSIEISPVYDIKLSAVATEAINNGLQELLLGGDPASIARKLQEAQAASIAQ